MLGRECWLRPLFPLWLLYSAQTPGGSLGPRRSRLLGEEGACPGCHQQQEVIEKKDSGGGIEGPTSFRV